LEEAMQATTLESVATRLEQNAIVDPISDRLQGVVRRAVPPESQRKDVLSGTWLGHALHPPLTDVVVGTWTSALLLDLVGGRDSARAARKLVAAGVLAAVPTAAAGLSDWADVHGGSRRVGTVHALGNTSALLLQTLSLAARRNGRRGTGIALSLAGFTAASFSAWLGGQLSFRKGVGVNQTAFDHPPAEWTAVLPEAELADGMLQHAKAGDLDVLLVRHAGRIYAMDDRCTHRGCSLHEGKLNDDETVTCPCHGSTFRLDGSIVKGPATAAQPAFTVRTNAGNVEIRRADAEP
jgi:nitrite reductase/ring-hydroxylating ferredoxin subunit/uncharacterized membrane protein